MFRTDKRRDARRAQLAMDRALDGDGEPVLRLRVDRDFEPFFLSSAATSPTMPSSAWMATSRASGNWPRTALPSRRSTTASVLCRAAAAAGALRRLSAERSTTCAQWLRRLPHPYTAADAQAAIATTSPSCRPSSRSPRCSTPENGRVLYEQVIRENFASTSGSERRQGLLIMRSSRGCASDQQDVQNVARTHPVTLSAAKDLTERSDTGRGAGGRSFAEARRLLRATQDDRDL